MGRAGPGYNSISFTWLPPLRPNTGNGVGLFQLRTIPGTEPKASIALVPAESINPESPSMKIHMNRTTVLTSIALAIICNSASALGIPDGDELIKDFDKFTGEVHWSKNLLKYEGMSVQYNAFVKEVSALTGKNGERIPVVALGSYRTKAGHVSAGMSDFLCVVDPTTAKSLDAGQRVSFKGVIKSVASQQRFNPTINQTVDDRSIVAACNITKQTSAAAPTAAVATPALSTAVRPKVPVDSHCAKGETIVFACAAGKKLISVCGTAGGLQYRFGPKGASELNWPDNPAQKNLVTHGSIMLAGGGGDYLRFTKGQTAYIIYSASTKSADKEGVAVEKDGKVIANVACSQPATSDLSGGAARAANTDPNAFSLP